MRKKKPNAADTPATHLRMFVDGNIREVPRAAYVTAKLRQLREFGYATLTREDVDGQVDAVLAKKPFGKGLTVIGKFMEGELLGGVRPAGKGV